MNKNKNTGYYIYASPKISKTHLMLSNSTHIINPDVRITDDYITAEFRNLNTLDNSNYKINKHDSLLQIYHPQLSPFFVHLIDEDNKEQQQHQDQQMQPIYPDEIINDEIIIRNENLKNILQH